MLRDKFALGLFDNPYVPERPAEIRNDLEPGVSKTVSFVVPLSLLAYTGIDDELIMEPGPVEVSAGGSSSDIRATAEFIVTGEIRVIEGEERAFLSAATTA